MVLPALPEAVRMRAAPWWVQAAMVLGFAALIAWLAVMAVVVGS
jgi:hypothetical protein